MTKNSVYKKPHSVAFYLSFSLFFLFLSFLNRHFLTNGHVQNEIFDFLTKIEKYKTLGSDEILYILSDFPQIPVILSLAYSFIPGPNTLFEVLMTPNFITALSLAFFVKATLGYGYNYVKVFIVLFFLFLNPFFLWGFSNSPSYSYQIILMAGVYLGFLDISKKRESSGFLLLSGSLSLLFINSWEGFCFSLISFILCIFLVSKELLKGSLFGVYLLIFFPVVMTILSVAYINWLTNKYPWPFLEFCRNTSQCFPVPMDPQVEKLLNVFLYSTGAFSPLILLNRNFSQIRFLFLLIIITTLATVVATWLGIIPSPHQMMAGLLPLLLIAFFMNESSKNNEIKKTFFLIAILILTTLTSWWAFFIEENKFTQFWFSILLGQNIEQEAASIIPENLFEKLGGNEAWIIEIIKAFAFLLILKIMSFLFRIIHNKNNIAYKA